MKQFIVVGICLVIFLCGCASSPVRTSLRPETDINGMLRLRRNMTPKEVVELMGSPEKPITIYFYLTEGKGSSFAHWSKDNYTPLVFVNNKLTGWGWNYLNGAAKNIMND